MSPERQHKILEVSNHLKTLSESQLVGLSKVIQQIAIKPKSNRTVKLQTILSSIPEFSDSKIDWIESVVQQFRLKHEYKKFKSNLVTAKILESFGDALLVHHSLSKEPLSKDRFEFMLERAAILSGVQAQIAPRGNPGHDIVINGKRYSLKTQANTGLRHDIIHISKFMELGHGKWGDDPKDLAGLRNQFMGHLKRYHRILTLRTLSKPPGPWLYELVEIPKTLLIRAKDGELEMRMKSRQSPKPGYCHVRSEDGDLLFELYFDGGGERKLQIKNLRKDLCHVHATWQIDFSESLF